MLIHVVRPGDSAYSIALEYGIPMSQLILDNGLEDFARLAVGQALVIQFPVQSHTVRPGETLSSIASAYGLTVDQLWRNNPILGGGADIYPGETLVIAYDSQPEAALSVSGYAYPFIGPRLLRATVPYLTYLTPFTYGFTPRGELVELDDGALLTAAAQGGAAALMHLSTLTESGGFSNELAHIGGCGGLRRLSGAAGGAAQSSGPAGDRRAGPQDIRGSAGRALRGPRLRRHRCGSQSGLSHDLRVGLHL